MESIFSPPVAPPFMNRFLLAISWVIGSATAPIVARAQTLFAAPLAHQFQTLDENGTDSTTVLLTNPGNDSLKIRIRHFPSPTGEYVFFNQDSIVVMGPGQLGFLKMRFSSRHNMAHQGWVLLESDRYGAQLLELNGDVQYSNPYYATTFNLTGPVLLSALRTRLALGYINLGYNTARDEMYADLDNTGGQVECVYTGRVATFNDRPGAVNNNFNCEHTFPQSFFNSADPQKSDIHHLFPTDEGANSVRSNHPFGVVNNPTWQQGGSKYGSSTFEPRDAHKGTVARAMMYFVTRYQDYQGFFAGQQSLLRQWHQQYPPSAQDIQRNQGIFALQNNRNPWVDYPQFGERLHSITGSGSFTPVRGFHMGPDTVRIRPYEPIRVGFVNYGDAPVNIVSVQCSDPAIQSIQPWFASVQGRSAVLDTLVLDPMVAQSGSTFVEYTVSDPQQPVRRVYIEYISTLSAQDPTPVPVLRLFPNPAQDWVTLAGWTPDMILRITDASGREWVVRQEPNGTRLDVSGLPSGVYVVHHQRQGAIGTLKLLIAR
ncbi:T9SS type A sorting domain-containing protein [bacterium]|nr:T9SS type A sorting domain-containing protein [bacterium]